MANYTYKCLDCGNVFDIEATIQEKEEGKNEKFVCLKCKSKNIKQKFSAINFIQNIFKSNHKAGDCCSRENTGNIDCRPDENEKNNCGCGNGDGGCRGKK